MILCMREGKLISLVPSRNISEIACFSSRAFPSCLHGQFDSPTAKPDKSRCSVKGMLLYVVRSSQFMLLLGDTECSQCLGYFI